MRKSFLVAAATVAMFSADMTASSAGAMSLSFSWAGIASCGSSPPAFTLSGVPSGTKQLAFNMIDLSYNNYNHGGGTIAYQGNKVPAGSFSYTGPCPRPGPNMYQVTVQALDGAGKVLATAVTTRPFPPH